MVSFFFCWVLVQRQRWLVSSEACMVSVVSGPTGEVGTLVVSGLLYVFFLGFGMAARLAFAVSASAIFCFSDEPGTRGETGTGSAVFCCFGLAASLVLAVSVSVERIVSWRR